MKVKDLFNAKNKEVPFSFVDGNLRNWFGDFEVEDGCKPLRGQRLGEPMNDYEIQAKFYPGNISMGEVYATLKTLDHDTYAIFYVKDVGGVLRTVCVRWRGGGWFAHAFAMGGYRWSDGNQVFSRNSSTPDTLSSDASIPSLPDTLVINGVTYHKQ